MDRLFRKGMGPGFSLSGGDLSADSKRGQFKSGRFQTGNRALIKVLFFCYCNVFEYMGVGDLLEVTSK